MRTAAVLMIFAAVGAGGCVRMVGASPNLAPRSAEAIDPRVPVPGIVNDRPVSPALASRLSALIAQARAGDRAFQPAAARARQLAGAAGRSQTESWVVAQEALSAAVGARAQTARALGDIDALGANALETEGGLAPADLAAIQSAAAEVGAIDRRQAETVAAIQRQLGL